ncbi:MAG: class I SAM-dependent methyltransferase [Proteobacteria bacterium]|nr:class I SAM-dependent methyltransferase [Pseudomonadota bacterium]
MLAAVILPGAAGAAGAAGAVEPGSPGFDEARLASIIAGAHRLPYNVARDPARHPLATLRFFGLAPDMHVAEIWPGGAGYYAEIIGPYVAAKGRYYAVVPSLDPRNARAARSNNMLFARFEAAPDLYGQPMRADMSARDLTLYTANSLDLVVTFRNLHNWAGAGFDRHFLAGIFKALKPGGRLGLVDHRLDGAPNEKMRIYGGYVTEDYAIEVAKSVGFELVAASEANANPRDGKDYDKGVWTLPPTLTLGEKDRALYMAIGESDRMTLLFRKPEAQDQE